MTLDERLAQIYADALTVAIRRYKTFFQKVRDVDSGKIQPPKWYVDRGLEAKWRQGFVTELVRKHKIIDGIMQELNSAGLSASQAIRDAMVDVYASVRSEAVTRLSEGAKRDGVSLRLSELTRQEMQTIIQKEQSPFSKIAFMNLGQNVAIRHRLQASMAQAVLLGESQQKMVKRIRKITGQAQYQAVRVAQTENTRIQSQATVRACQEAENKGVRVYYKWITRMVRSRDTHIELNGKCARPGDAFPGSVLHFPGDPSAPAREVINCHCRLAEHVLLSDEEIVDGRVVKKTPEPLNNQGFGGIIKEDSDTFILDWKQFGKKVGKHASDFGYDPSSEEDRQKVLTIIYDIKNNPAEKRIGYWRGQPDEVFFYIKGKDVVITKQTGEFVTIMKGGTANDRVKNARNTEI